MSTRLTWLLGLLVLISIGWLLACGGHYSASSDGLVIVPSQGSAVLQAFSFNLSNGHPAQINTSPAITPAPQAGSAFPIAVDAAGSYAYVASTVTCSVSSLSGAVRGVVGAYKVNSDGTLSATGTPVNLLGNSAYPGPPTFPTCGLDDQTNPNPGNAPIAMTMDSSGKFLFVATQLSSVTNNSVAPPITVTLAGKISVLSIGSNASLTEIPGSPFSVPAVLGGATPDVSGVAVSPTSFPAQNAACSGMTAPTTENLYATDRANNQVFEYSVDLSAGTLAPVPGLTGPGTATGPVPSGVTVDPCNRFVYVSNNSSNNVSGYTICNVILLPNCPSANGSLVSTGAATSAGNGPTVLEVDPLGNFLYVVDHLQNAVSGFKISPASGTLSALSPATVTVGSNAVAIAIRRDDQWLFVANNGSSSVSQFSITPASGTLSPTGAITTDNLPWGVAVK